MGNVMEVMFLSEVPKPTANGVRKHLGTGKFFSVEQRLTITLVKDTFTIAYVNDLGETLSEVFVPRSQAAWWTSMPI